MITGGIIGIRQGDTPIIPRPPGKVGVFYRDYDGRLLSTTWLNPGEGFAGPVPGAPDHTDKGWTFAGWNWQPADMARLWVDQHVMPAYVAADGATEFEVEINALTAPAGTLQFRLQFVAEGTTIDYGDGTVDTLAAGSPVIQHPYAPGIYRGRIVSPGEAPHTLGSAGVNFIGGIDTATRQALRGIIVGRNVTLAAGACTRGSLRWAVLNDTVTLAARAFADNVTLEYLSVPRGAASIPDNLVSGCRSMRIVSLPASVASLGITVFQNCNALENSNNLRAVEQWTGNVHQSNYSLECAYIGPAVTSIAAGAFQDCGNLRDIIVDCPTPPTLANVSAFTGLNALCRIWVRDQILEALKAATNWNVYAGQMYPLSAMPNFAHPSYWIGTDGVRHGFSRVNTPLSNLSNATTPTGTYTIENAAVVKNTIREIVFGDDYSYETSIPNYFLYNVGANLQVVDFSTFTRVKTIGNLMLQTLLTRGITVDLSPFMELNSIGYNFCFQNFYIRGVQIGSVDFSGITVGNNALGGTDTSAMVLQADSQALADAFKMAIPAAAPMTVQINQ